jgi:putative spermidine/putrescine transport system substrate-binding protein
MPDFQRRKFLVQGSTAALAGMAGLNSSSPASAAPTDELVAAAKAEGHLTVVGLPRDWWGYGDIIDGFKAKYGLGITELMPDAGSAKVINTIRNARDTADPQAPDVIDVGLPFALSAKRDGLLRPYKEPDGYWYGGYYGTLAFEVNADIVTTMPTDWADLASPKYRNAVGLAGNLTSNQAIQGIFAAGLSAAHGNVDEAADQGLSFFADLSRRGNFVPIVGGLASLEDGRTPILVRWDYLAATDRERSGGRTRIEIVRPKTGIVGGVYAQAISAFTPHPNAARLWMEYLYTETRAFLNSGYAPADLEGKLARVQHSGTEVYPLFPTQEELDRAREIITNGWGDVVGVQIQCLPSGSPSGIPMVFSEGIGQRTMSQ